MRKKRQRTKHIKANNKQRNKGQGAKKTGIRNHRLHAMELGIRLEQNNKYYKS